MPKKLGDLIRSLPKARQNKIEARAMELMTLPELRRATSRTQVVLASALGVRQDAISRIERREDMLLSTLREYVESLGGHLQLVAQFPDRPPVVIAPMDAKPRKARRPASHSRRNQQ